MLYMYHFHEYQQKYERHVDITVKSYKIIYMYNDPFI